jgi:hypothetical protein
LIAAAPIGGNGLAVRERKGFAGLSMTVPPTIYQIPREKEDGQEVNLAVAALENKSWCP